MQNRVIEKITSSTKIVTLFLIILIIVVAKSLFLNLSLIILILILAILYNISVSEILNFTKKTCIWLLIIVIIYLLIFKEFYFIFIFAYKFLIIIIYTYIIICSLNFDKLDSGINGLLSLFIKTKTKDKISFQITLDCYYIMYLANSFQIIIKRQISSNKINFGLKHFMIPSLLNADQSIKKLERSLVLNLYKVKREKLNFVSIVTCFTFFIVLVISIFKEVIF